MMKKIVMLLIAVAAFAATASAQKFAFIDQEYILKKIPNYEMANEQLNQISQRWQREVETLEKEAYTMSKNYQADMVFLTDEQKKKQQSLIKPIQDDIYAACKKVCEEKGYQVIFDRASIQGAMYVSPRIDVTDEVIAKLGY